MVYDSEREYTAELAELFVDRAIRTNLVNYASSLKTAELLAQMDREMMALFNDIVNILNGQSLDDPDRFYRVEALVRAFEKIHCPVRRHDW